MALETAKNIRVWTTQVKRDLFQALCRDFGCRLFLKIQAPGGSETVIGD